MTSTLGLSLRAYSVGVHVHGCQVSLCASLH
jgi:hypothetical protein